jgi:endonuclease III related protein
MRAHSCTDNLVGAVKRQTLFLNMFHAMLDALGPSRWWPAETPFEVAVGAVLTQNTSWANVERALSGLKAAGPFDARSLLALPDGMLAERIRPAGYFRLKARRLKNLLELVVRDCDGDITRLAETDLDTARQKLLSVSGVGPETADSILLYALGLPSFVVDAYTARICHRHALVAEDADYETLRELFMDALPPDVALYNEFHALLVRVGNSWCRPRAPRCRECPLERFLL